MKRKIHIWCSLLLVFTLLLPAGANAAQAPSLALAASNEKPAVGDEITITVKGTDFTDLYAFEFKLYYNATALEFVTGSERTALSGFKVPVKLSSEGGSHLVFAHTKTGSTATVNGSSELATFTFKVKSTALSAISLKQVQLVDSKLVQTKLAAGAELTIGVAATPTPSPSSSPTPSPTTSPTASPTPSPSTSPTGSPTASPTGSPTPSSSPSPTTNPTPSPATGSTPAPTSTAAADTLVITASELGSGAGDKAIVKLASGATKVSLPSNAAELLGERELVVEAAGLQMTVPSAVLQQLAGIVADETLKGGVLMLETIPVQAAKLAETAETLSGDLTAAVQAGHVYEFSMYVRDVNGGVHPLRAFEFPLTVQFNVDPALNPKLTGIYYLSGEGKPQYVDSAYADGKITAEINHFSTYALLEINKTFTDVRADFWASDAIKVLAARQVVSGTSERKFEPGSIVTRAEFTSLLVRALGLTEQGDATFADVPEGAWYAKDVSIAVKAGLIKGRSAERFAPSASITREELAALIVRAYELKHGSVPEVSASSFKDLAAVSAWASSDVKKAAALGIVHGRADSLFVPQGTSNRAEAAQVVYKLLMEQP